MLVAACAIALTPAAALAEIRSGGVDDALGDTPITLGGDRLADVKRVEAQYDREAGKVTFTFILNEALPYYYSASIAGAIAQTDVGGECKPAAKTGDLSLSGYFSSYYYGGTYSSVYANGVGIASSTGNGAVNPDRTRITMSAQGSPIANLDYRCVTNLSHDESSSSSGTWTSGQDTIGQFFFTGQEPAPPVTPGFVTIENPPSLDRGTIKVGEVLNATAKYKNVGGQAVTVKQAIITARRPGEPHVGPKVWDNFTPYLEGKTLAAGQELGQAASVTIPSDAPTGTWDVYATWRDTDDVWHDGPSSFVTVQPATTTSPDQGGSTSNPDAGTGSGGSGTGAGPGTQTGGTGTPTGEVLGQTVTGAAPKVAVLRMPERPLRPDRQGRITFVLECPADGPARCTGEVTLLRGGRTLARHGFDIGRDKIGVVRLRLRARDLKALTRAKSQRVKAVVRSADRDGQVRERTTPLTLRRR